jgi:hypothetical protein
MKNVPQYQQSVPIVAQPLSYTHSQQTPGLPVMTGGQPIPNFSGFSQQQNYQRSAWVSDIMDIALVTIIFNVSKL